MVNKEFIQKNLEKYSTSSKFYERALEVFLTEYQKATAKKERFTVAFSGGNTPKPLFKLLGAAGEKIDWTKVEVFIVDERYLPKEHKDSNYGVISESFLERVPLPKENIHEIKYLATLEESRGDYEERLNDFFKGKEISFDLILLGMGDDGHTASLFPDSVKETGEVVTSPESDYHPYARVSLGLRLINRCPKKVFLLGKGKDAILSKLPTGDYPAGKIEGDVTYILEV